MKALLDVNVLIALLTDGHIHAGPAKQWFVTHRADGWATCTITQSGFLRIGMQLQGVPDTLHLALTRFCELPGHEFWNLDYPVTELRPEIRSQLRGPKHVTDAILLDLAIRRGARFVTLDRRVRALLPPDSPHQAVIDVLVGA